jgi:hypothetical protein
VVEQDPIAGSKVKEGRKIYIKINSSGFSTVRIPNLIENLPPSRAHFKGAWAGGRKDYLQTLPSRDMVLEMHFNGKKLNPGTRFSNPQKLIWFWATEKSDLKKK